MLLNPSGSAPFRSVRCAGHFAARPQMIARHRRPAAPERAGANAPLESGEPRLRPVPRHRRCEPPRAPRPNAPGTLADFARADGGFAPPAVPQPRPRRLGTSLPSRRQRNYLVSGVVAEPARPTPRPRSAASNPISGVLGDRRVIPEPIWPARAPNYRAMVGPFATRNEAIQSARA